MSCANVPATPNETTMNSAATKMCSQVAAAGIDEAAALRLQQDQQRRGADAVAQEAQRPGRDLVERDPHRRPAQPPAEAQHHQQELGGGGIVSSRACAATWSPWRRSGSARRRRSAAGRVLYCVARRLVARSRPPHDRHAALPVSAGVGPSFAMLARGRAAVPASPPSSASRRQARQVRRFVTNTAGPSANSACCRPTASPIRRSPSVRRSNCRAAPAWRSG